MDRLIYDSASNKEHLRINAPYYNAINPTTVYFGQEKISVYVNEGGHIEFFDENENSLGYVDFPVSDDPSEYSHTARYGQVECSADNNIITVFLPVYYWTDSYPNCDGESDRWSRYISRWFRVVFDCESKEISVLDKNKE